MKYKVNFEYNGDVIPIMLDESLIHINNLTNQIAETRAEGFDTITDEWEEAYDYLEDKCREAFFEETEFDFDSDNIMIDGFINTKEEDETSLRVRMIDIVQ